jgi:hypothetical protein
MNDETIPTSDFDHGLWPRALDALIGVWLLVSAIALHATGLQMSNAIVVGVLVILAAGIAAFVIPEARFANTALGIWLFLSSLMALGPSEAMLWNDVVVGGLLVALSLVPGTARNVIWARHAES